MDHSFDINNFMPHGHCYLWKPEILWMHVGSDFLIALAYFSIPIAMSYYVIKSEHKGPLLSWVIALFVAFITLCGLTHVMSIWTTWNPNYWVEGVLKTLTALASIVTASALWPLIPKALKIPSPESLNEANKQLNELNSSLEQKVKIRTQEIESKSENLEATNRRLQSFQDMTTGREERMIELKKEINELCNELGHKPRYDIPEL